MKRLLRVIWAVLSSRAMSPLVIGIFLLVYIGIAFITDETLIVLMQFTRKAVFLTALLALLPLNSAARIVTEAVGYLGRRRALAGSAAAVPPGVFDETVELSAPPAFAELQGRLDAVGYKTRRTESALAAWRGVGMFPARMLFLAGTFCLFAGILISLSSRVSSRGAIIEGEPLPVPSGAGGIVERINLEQSSGAILEKNLTMEAAPSGSGEGRKIFGVYPPSRYEGAFVYPRYLGIALRVRFSAPDLQPYYETQLMMNVYPPGKEYSAQIPGSPYRIVFSLAKPDDGSDPYMTGRMIFPFKILKGKDLLFSGSAAGGGEFARDGYRLALSDARRLVITDFVRDYGVLLIWTSGILFVVAGSIWLPVRVFFPRREMLFRSGAGVIQACSRAEGEGRRHAEVFHEALDILEGWRHDRPPSAG